MAKSTGRLRKLPQANDKDFGFKRGKSLKRTIRATLSCATALSVMPILPTFAAAQTTPATAEPKAIETIVVTGSRIRRSAANAAAPLIQVT